MKLTKCQAKLVNYLNGGNFYVHQGVSYELHALFGSQDKDIISTLQALRAILTYTNRERKDMLHARNWLHEFITTFGYSNAMVRSVENQWSDPYEDYLDTWDVYHQDEIDDWNAQPEQQYRAGLVEFAEKLGQEREEKENYFDKLAFKASVLQQTQQSLNTLSSLPQACPLVHNDEMVGINLTINS